MTGVTVGAGLAYSFRAPDVTEGFQYGGLLQMNALLFCVLLSLSSVILIYNNCGLFCSLYCADCLFPVLFTGFYFLFR